MKENKQLTQSQKQQLYRDARVKGLYDNIWQNVGKCAFCDLRDKYVFFEENGVVMTVALYAYIDGHFMIIPRRHVTSAKEMTPFEWQTVRKFLYVAKKLIKEVRGIKGMQLVQKDGTAAQSTVGHIHFHCVPFDAPDLSTWNYRELKNTPLQNAELYKKAHKKLTKWAAKFDEKYNIDEATNPTAETQSVQVAAISGNTSAELSLATPSTPSPYDFDWAALAFGSKKPINKLKATFIAASRELSVKRFTQLVKEYLPASNIVLGLAKEPYVIGLEGQPHFTMLARDTVQGVIDKVNRSVSKHKIYTLAYNQRDTSHVLQKLDFAQVALVNGSWYQSFHTLPAYYVLVNKGVAYSHVSPFADDIEAKAYAVRAVLRLEAAYPAPTAKKLSDIDMMQAATDAAKLSFDYTFQTGVALGKKFADGYAFLARACNLVVPYPTYAMHHGVARERHFSPPGDLNHYDANHAEVNFMVIVQKQGLNLAGTTLFINLLPCPTCCRMLCETDIAEVVYKLDHSDGYAVRMFTAAGKKVRRIVD